MSSFTCHAHTRTILANTYVTFLSTKYAFKAVRKATSYSAQILVWLSMLPLKDKGYCLNEQEFWDLMKLVYGFSLLWLPSQCICGVQNDVQHALYCKKGGFITLRHNRIRNVTAEWLRQVTKDVKIGANIGVNNWWDFLTKNSKHKWWCSVGYY